MKLIPEYKLIAQPVSSEGFALAGFKWADAKIGTRHKMGGTPDLLQRQDIPRCGVCANAMVFYAQLDSIGDLCSFGDCGMAYLFVCFDCNEASAFIQSH